MKITFMGTVEMTETEVFFLLFRLNALFTV